MAGHSVTAILSDDHHGSHRQLLWYSDSAKVARDTAPDALVVPTIRHPIHLEHAAGLAARLGCPLVTLHSRKYTSAKAAADRLAGQTDLLAIDISDPAFLRLPDFETSHILPDRFTRRTDTSAKRNLALLLSHLVGWKSIIFLDDDITVPDVGHLRAAAGLLGTYNAVGLSIGGFPDNSVVCHAYHDAGGNQDSFIGGGALAVEVSRHHSFFPTIYNEDWFYLLDAKTGLHPLAVTGKVKQRPYDPYRNEERARAEEFGDVLAEGVFWLLDEKRSIAEADRKHWKDFLARRDRFIGRVLRMVEEEQEKLEPGQKKRMVDALKAAKGRLALITPELCQDYLQALARDQLCWQRHIDQQRELVDLEDALGALTKPGEPALSWEIRNDKGSLPYAGTAASSSRSPRAVALA